jgi:hypothetical protein
MVSVSSCIYDPYTLAYGYSYRRKHAVLCQENGVAMNHDLSISPKFLFGVQLQNTSGNVHSVFRRRHWPGKRLQFYVTYLAELIASA